jgi:NADPH:quinone reductase
MNDLMEHIIKVDVVYDPVGMVLPSLKCIKFGGRILVIGFAGGTIEKVSLMGAKLFTGFENSLTFQIPMNLVLLKNVSLVGTVWGGYLKNSPETIPEVWKGIMQLIRDGRLKPVVFEKIYE